MTEDPNLEQQQLIQSHDGIYKVDAGAGTGKTFTITRRYASILEQKDVSPEDILLLTYTNSAADEMKERIINYCSYNMRDLREAPISTFHSLCKKIVDRDGFEVPQELGIDEQVASSTQLIDNEVLEKQEFRQFMDSFIEENPEYNNFYKILYEYSELLGIIKKLASKGVIPTEEGWYRGTEEHLEGDFEQFWEQVESRNECPDGNKTELKDDIEDIFEKCLEPEAPSKDKVLNENTVEEEFVHEAFHESREGLKNFIHDVYHSYFEHCLSRNYLNFGFVLVLAYVLLCEDEQVREENRFEYTLLDEFQDTNEIQFKISLLLSKGNICVVGDWKQSIYSFQYVEVENIENFEGRIQRYRQELNQDEKRIDYSVDQIDEISLKTNYRSSQEILDFSEHSFDIKGKSGEELEEKEITSLEANKETDTTIEGFQSEEEIEAVLQKIQEVVESSEYKVDGEEASYGDIAVMARRRKFGMELKEKAEEYGIPVSYEGGIELFKTDAAKLLLAWLRVLEYEKSSKGWAVILEEAGYNLPEIREIMPEDRKPSEISEFPSNILQFRQELEGAEEIASKARKVFSRYGIENGFTDKIIEVLRSTFENSYRNQGEIITFIEECIQHGENYEVDNSLSENTVTVQTIHSAKGLEYPIVFISDINNRRFPQNNSDSTGIIYDETLGIRQKREFLEETSYIHDSWKAQTVLRSMPSDYDEERRLMYVAMTRAEQHLFLSSTTGKASYFFKDLKYREGIETEEIEPELSEVEVEDRKAEELEIDEPEEKKPVKRSVHSVMDLNQNTEGRGKEFGVKVHKFAEQYANGEDIEPRNKDEENVKEFIDSLEGELKTETPIKVPREEDGRKVVYHGVIDLLHITDEKVDIIDWKTDLTRANEEEYQKQLEIYEKGVEEMFDKETEKNVFYTSN